MTPPTSCLILYEKGEDRKLNIPFLVHSKSSFVPCPQFSPLLVLSLSSTFLCPFQVLVCSFSSSFPCPFPQLFPSSLILSLTSTFNFPSSFSCSCLQIFPSLHPFPVLVLSFSLLPILSLSPTIICPFQTLLFPPFLLFSLSSLF